MAKDDEVTPCLHTSLALASPPNTQEKLWNTTEDTKGTRKRLHTVNSSTEGTVHSSTESTKHETGRGVRLNQPSSYY